MMVSGGTLAGAAIVTVVVIVGVVGSITGDVVVAGVSLLAGAEPLAPRATHGRIIRIVVARARLVPHLIAGPRISHLVTWARFSHLVARAGPVFHLVARARLSHVVAHLVVVLVFGGLLVEVLFLLELPVRELDAADHGGGQRRVDELVLVHHPPSRLPLPFLPIAIVVAVLVLVLVAVDPVSKDPPTPPRTERSRRPPFLDLSVGGQRKKAWWLSPWPCFSRSSLGGRLSGSSSRITWELGFGRPRASGTRYWATISASVGSNFNTAGVPGSKPNLLASIRYRHC
ncbi:uncharacterized protein LOC112270855 [Brachypodium distachyon]|uniref:uncharacterized protein LOC112270855 n=1 Tax=Brachypodium distachyon TaxID=15368 RepID=UPI000D0DB2E1|nr:uncharacterized protein LOC112270855 [Brachypodium distachyon]|eukprot:XP_024315047.1 uncharacterized protein LOC112270855 [Brachypodium distachyon]